MCASPASLRDSVSRNADASSEHTRHGAAWRSYDPPLDFTHPPYNYAHSTEATVSLILDFVAGDKRADAPPGGWPEGWLRDTDDKAITHALMLACEMDVFGLKHMFQQSLGFLESEDRVDYRRMFRETAVGGNELLSGYFASKIWVDEWEKKHHINAVQAFTLEQLAGIPASYLWAFSRPLMVDENGKRPGNHHPLAPDSQANVLEVQRHFKGALDRYNGGFRPSAESQLMLSCQEGLRVVKMNPGRLYIQ